MKIDQLKFYEALESAIYAYKCFKRQNHRNYTPKEHEEMQSEIQLLTDVHDEMRTWTCEEIIIDEMPF